MTRTKTQKTATTAEALATAVAARELAEEGLASATVAVVAATDAVRQIVSAIDAGDQMVKAMDLLTAEGELRLAQGRERASSDQLAKARSREAEAVAADVAEQVATEWLPVDVAERIASASAAVEASVRDIRQAFAERDAASNAAGSRLEKAGVPEKVRLGRLSYGPVQGATGQKVAGKFNLALDGEVVKLDDGDWPWLANRELDKILSSALRANGLRLSGDKVTSR